MYDLDGGIQGYNVFLYCANNPTNRIDSSGADSDKVDDLDLIDGELCERGGSGDGFSGGGSHGVSWNEIIDSFKAAANGLCLASGARDSLLSEPKSPELIKDNYIKSNKIDAHMFKNKAGNVPQGKLSKYNIYKDKANHNRLWVGSNNIKNRDWRETMYFFDDLITLWRK